MVPSLSSPAPKGPGDCRKPCLRRLAGGVWLVPSADGQGLSLTPCSMTGGACLYGDDAVGRWCANRMTPVARQTYPTTVVTGMSGFDAGIVARHCCPWGIAQWRPKGGSSGRVRRDGAGSHSVPSGPRLAGRHKALQSGAARFCPISRNRRSRTTSQGAARRRPWAGESKAVSVFVHIRRRAPFPGLSQPVLISYRVQYDHGTSL